MTITRVQGNQVNSAGTGTSQAVTLGSGITQGNLVVAAVACGSNNTTITGPSGWTQGPFNQPAGSNATIETNIWYMVVSAGHAGETSWTWTFGASHTMYICIEEWSATNGWQASVVDKTANGDTVGSPVQATTIDSGTTASTTQASELWVAALAYKGSAQSESSITSGWTKDLEATLASNNTLTMLYKVASSTGAADCSYVIGSAAYWAGSVATFLPVVVTTSSRTVPATAALQSTLTRTITSTAALQSTNARTVPATAALSQSGIARTIPATAAIANTFSRTIPSTASLSQPVSRTVPASAALIATISRTIPSTAALQSLSNPRTIPATAALLATKSRTVPANAALLSTVSRTIPATAALKGTLSRTIPASASLIFTISRTIPASVSLTSSAVFYASNVTQTLGGLTQSDQMSTVAGGTETSFTVTAPSSGTNSYVELRSQGGSSSGTPVLPSPTGRGWSINLQGNTILAGSWSSVFTLAKSGTSKSGASLIVRYYRRTMDGTPYVIGVSTLSSQTFSTTKTVYIAPSVLASWPWQFVSGDTLYMDAFVFNAATAWASDVFTVYVSNSASLGVYNDAIIISPMMIASPPGLTSRIGATAFQTGDTLPILNQSITLADAIDQRSILTFTGKDVDGTLSYQRAMPVQLSDYDQGLLYTGAVNSDKVSKHAAGDSSAELAHMLTFMDNHYLVDKRSNVTNYLNWSAGDMVCDFIQQTLSQEGITGEFALESDYTPTTFAQGTLSGTVATTTTSPFTYAPNTATPPITSNTGDLELTRAGTQFTLTESVPSDFSSGTLTNMTATGNSLKPTTQSALKFQSQMPIQTTANNTGSSSIDSSTNTLESIGNSAYAQIWAGSMTVGSNDTLNYDIWIASSSPAYLAAVDLTFSDGTLFSSHAYGTPDDQTGPTGYVGLWDQNNTSADFLTDLSNYAKDAWYARRITLTGLNGKTITEVHLAIVGASAGAYTVYVKNCYLGSQSGSPFFSTSATAPQVNPPPIKCQGGYVAATSLVAVVNVFRPAQSTRISPAHSISSVGLVQNSTITWSASLPTSGTSSVVYPPGSGTGISAGSGSQAMLIYVSYDATTWLLCTNQGALPGLPAGANIAGLSLYLMEQFQAGSDPTAIPSLLQVNITINSAAAQTTTDVVAAYGNATTWNTGTYNGTTTNSNGDLVNGGTYIPNWNSGTPFNWTMHQMGSHANLSFSSGTMTISDTGDSGNNNQVLSFDDVPPLMNGIIECDVSSSSAGTNQWSRTGVIYRGGNWNSGYIGGSSFTGGLYDPIMTGYLVFIQADTVNSTMFVALVALSTSGAPNAFASYNTTISQNTFYHLKIVFENNRHTIYFNNGANPVIDMLDSTYVGAGVVGVYSLGTNGGSTNSQATSKWKNYTLTPLGNGTWQSAAISLSSLGTCGYTQISWSEQGENGYSQSTAIVLASTNGGTAWQQCTNNAEIPQLPVGTSTSGVSLLIQVILFTNTFVTTPAIIGLYVRVCGNYGTATGTRISPALNLSPVGYVAASNVMYNANVPTSTSLTVQTTQDLSTFHTVGNSGAGEALTYWTNQPDATQDLFATNTLATYTNTAKSGGSAAGVTYTTANSSLTLAGGSSGLYLNLAINCSDVDLITDMDRSDAGGPVGRFVDTSNYYEVGVYDALSASGFTNQLRLYKVASGTRTLLGSASNITFTRGTFHRVRLTIQGGLINVYFDGTCKQSYLDMSPLGAGACGLRNDGGTSRYYQLWVQPLGTNLSGQKLQTKVTMTTTDPSVMPQLFTLVACVRGPSIATGATISQLHSITKPFAAYYSTEIDSAVQASGDFYWYVDKWKQLRFGPRLARPGAFPVQTATDQDPANPANIHSGYLLYQPQVSMLSSADLFRNEQIVTNVSGLVTPPPEIKTADGSTTSWSMGYPLYSAPVILINGQSATVGLQGIDNNHQFYWQPGSPSISYDSSLPKLPAGTILSFTYVGESSVNVPLSNSSSQIVQAALELNSGIVSEIQSALNSTASGMTTDQATTFGNGLLDRYGQNDTIEMVGTTRYGGLVPGTTIPLFLPELLSTWNAQLPITKLTTTVYQGANGLIYLYSINATNGAGQSNWTRMFMTR